VVKDEIKGPIPAKPKKEEASTPVSPQKPVAAVGTPKRDCPRGMVKITGGTAYLGSASNDPMRNFGESKLHQEHIDTFCIDRYEYPNVSGKKPSTGVSWKQAAQLCRSRGKRLCTEGEWEYACKGRSNLRFPYGNKWNSSICNTETEDGEDRNPAVIGSYKQCRSPFGVYDMSGNVSEWTASLYSPAATARTYKGGSSVRPNWATRCASRGSLAPGSQKNDLGFRCCADQK